MDFPLRCLPSVSSFRCRILRVFPDPRSCSCGPSSDLVDLMDFTLPRESFDSPLPLDAPPLKRKCDNFFLPLLSSFFFEGFLSSLFRPEGKCFEEDGVSRGEPLKRLFGVADPDLDPLFFFVRPTPNTCRSVRRSRLPFDLSRFPIEDLTERCVRLFVVWRKGSRAAAASSSLLR